MARPAVVPWAQKLTVGTGSPRPRYELGLIQGQFDRSNGFFACERTGLFSDKDLEQAPSVRFTKVVDVEGDWHIAKRKTTGAWVNTGLFSQAWKASAAEGHWDSADWIVKVDPGAIFVPSRLQQRRVGQNCATPAKEFMVWADPHITSFDQAGTGKGQVKYGSIHSRYHGTIEVDGASLDLHGHNVVLSHTRDPAETLVGVWRRVARVAVTESEVELTLINVSPFAQRLAFQMDSIHGRYDGSIEMDGGSLVLDGHEGDLPHF